MATAVKKTAILSKPKTNGTAKKQSETPFKFTKKQLESFKIHEAAAKAGGELARAGILKPYKKSY